MDPAGQCDVQTTSVGEVVRFDSDAIGGDLVVAVVVVVVVTLGVMVYVWWRRRYIYIYIYRDIFNINHYYKYVHNLPVYNSHCTLHYIIGKFIILNLFRYYITLKICILFFPGMLVHRHPSRYPSRHPSP